MDLFARVNIMGGRSVRLPRGDVREAIPLDNDPLARAQSWVAQGADVIHIVDLDAAAFGNYRNREIVDRILGAIDNPVQVAGGIRSHIEAARLLEAGAIRIVMGTAAIEDQNMIWDLCREHPGRVMVSLDVRPDREIATRGWTRNSGRYMEEVLIEMSSAGVASFLVAEANRDALAEPPDYEILAEALATVEEPVIAAGGVRNLSDLRRLTQLEMHGRKLAGVIVGREVTHGRFTIPEAKEVLAGGGTMAAPGQVIEHRSLINVSEFARSAHFYEQTLGFQRIRAWHHDGEGPVVIVRTVDGGSLELRGPSASRIEQLSKGMALVFRVDDVQAWHDYLSGSDVAIASELSDNAWGEVSFGVDDPDGLRVWFTQSQ